eukprot:5323368-Amphidinium_carterae.1
MPNQGGELQPVGEALCNAGSEDASTVKTEQSLNTCKWITRPPSAFKGNMHIARKAIAESTLSPSCRTVTQSAKANKKPQRRRCHEFVGSVHGGNPTYCANNAQFQTKGIRCQTLVQRAASAQGTTVCAAL